MEQIKTEQIKTKEAGGNPHGETAGTVIKEVIVVEGRDDTAAIKRAVNAQTIETHGYGIRKETWALLEKADREKGLIIFTDPDFAGNQIRKRLTERFPQAGQAYLSQKDALKAGDIGIENAAPESIRQALEKAHYSLEQEAEEFTMDDLCSWGLSQGSGSAEKRDRLGKRLGIGYGNSKRFLSRMNQYGITREQVLRELENL